MKTHKTPKLGTPTERAVILLRNNPLISYAEVAEQVGMTRHRVATIGSDYGLLRSNKMNQKTKSKVLRLLKQGKLNYAEIGLQCGGYSKQSIRDMAIKHGFPMRKRGRQKRTYGT